MRRTLSCLLVGLALPLAGCQEPEAGDGAHAHAPHDAADTAHVTPHDDPAHAGDPAASSHEALPLRTIMQRLDRDMASFAHALWLEDYAGMHAAAAAIADHPHVSPQEMQRIQGVLGPDMARFAAADHTVHEAAVRLSDAAGARSLDAVLRELSAVQTGCVACHTQFRERVRAER